MISLDQLDRIRIAEIDRIIPFLKSGAHILEVGAGTGRQAIELSKRGYKVTAIEIPDSNYLADRLYPITDYDGRHIPLPDASVDIVYSSNVLEHVPDLTQMHAEIRRVLKPGGYCIHIMPTHAWRFWTIVSSFPEAVVYSFANFHRLFPHALPNAAEPRRLGDAWYRFVRYVGGRIFQRRHGERGNVISELWLFRPQWWRRNFRANGFTIVHDEPMGLFYTGNMLLGPHLGIAQRERIARVLGSACHLFRVVPNPA